MHLELLDSIPLFAGLSGDEKWDLARRINIRDVPAGHPLFWINERGEEFFVIQSGHVAITVPDEDGQKEVTLAVLGPGDFFGDLALIDSAPRAAQARAASDCVLGILFRADFHNILETDPRTGSRLYQQLARHVGRLLRETVLGARGDQFL